MTFARHRPVFVLAPAFWAGLVAACSLSSDVDSLGNGSKAGPGGAQGSAGGAGRGGSTGAGGSPTQGAGGSPTQGAGGGTTPPGESFLRLANLLPISENPADPTPSIDVCIRPEGSTAWQGPALANAGGRPLGAARAGAHLPLPPGAYQARVVPDGLPCDAPEAFESEVELATGDYKTLALLSDQTGDLVVALYGDGAPSTNPNAIEVSFSNALSSFDFGLTVEPLGLRIDPLGYRQERLAPGPFDLQLLTLAGAASLGFAPAAPLRLDAPFGHSLFFFYRGLDPFAPSALLCRNGADASPPPAGDCDLVTMTPLFLPTRRPPG